MAQWCGVYYWCFIGDGEADEPRNAQRKLIIIIATWLTSVQIEPVNKARVAQFFTCRTARILPHRNTTRRPPQIRSAIRPKLVNMAAPLSAHHGRTSEFSPAL